MLLKEVCRRTFTESIAVLKVQIADGTAAIEVQRSLQDNVLDQQRQLLGQLAEAMAALREEQELRRGLQTALYATKEREDCLQNVLLEKCKELEDVQETVATTSQR